MTPARNTHKQTTRRPRRLRRTRAPVPAGRASGRSLARLRVPAHRATTRNLQAVYPFVVDSTLSSRTKDALHAVRSRGVRVVAATARPRRSSSEG